MCLGEEARALRCLGGLDWLNSQCPISPTGPMSSGTKAASCWRFLLTGQKLLESSRLPAPTPTPASQPWPPPTALLPTASSPSSPRQLDLLCLVTSAEPRTDLGVSGEQAPELDGWERGRSGTGPCVGRPFASLDLRFPKCWSTLERMEDACRSH